MSCQPEIICIRCFYDTNTGRIHVRNSHQDPQLNWWESTCIPEDRECWPVLYFATTEDMFRCARFLDRMVEKDQGFGDLPEDCQQDLLLDLFGDVMTFRRPIINEMFQPIHKKPLARKARNRKQRKWTQTDLAAKREDAAKNPRIPCEKPHHELVSRPVQADPDPGDTRFVPGLPNSDRPQPVPSKLLQEETEELGKALRETKTKTGRKQQVPLGEDDFAPLKTTILGTLPAEISREYCQWLFEQTDGSTLRPVTHLADPNDLHSDLTIALRHGNDLDVDDKKFIRSAKGRLTRRLKKWVNA